MQFANDEVIITWCFCSAETFGFDESMLDFIAAEYVVVLIIHSYCFCRIYRMIYVVFPYCYVGRFVLKHCVADIKVADCTDIE